MDDTLRLLLGFLFLILGILMIRLRLRLAPWLTGLYHKLGIDVPEEQYARQFYFIGILMILFGFLIATNFITFL